MKVLNLFAYIPASFMKLWNCNYAKCFALGVISMFIFLPVFSLYAQTIKDKRVNSNNTIFDFPTNRVCGNNASGEDMGPMNDCFNNPQGVDAYNNSVSIKLKGSTKSSQYINNGCTGDPIDIEIIEGGGPTKKGDYKFIWYKSNDGKKWSEIPGATAETYKPSSKISQTTFFIRKVYGNTTSSTPSSIVDNCLGLAGVFILDKNGSIDNNKITGGIDNEELKDNIKFEDPNQDIYIIGSIPNYKGISNGFMHEYHWEYSEDNKNWKALSYGLRDYCLTSASSLPALGKTYYYRRTSALKGAKCITPDVSNTVSVTRVGSKPVPNTIKPLSSTSICGISSINPGKMEGSGNTSNFSLIKWIKSEDGISWTEIAGAGDISYEPSVPITVNTSFCRVVVFFGDPTNKTDSSNVIEYKIYKDGIKSNTIDKEQTIKEGQIPDDLKGTVPTGGGGNYKYTWQQSYVNTATGGWTAASGNNTEKDYSFNNNNKPNKTTYYRRVVSSAAGCSDTSNSILITVASSADLSIIKESSISDIYENCLLYTIKITNKGPNTSRDIEVTDDIPNTLEYKIHIDPEVGNVSWNAGSKQLKWIIKELGKGSSIKLLVHAAPLNLNKVENTVKVNSQVPDPDLSNNISTDIKTNIKFGVDRLPNIVTPNGDGINDYLQFSELNSLTNNQLTIYDRWGTRVYMANNYKNDWDGQGLISGTYYYVLTTKVGNKDLLYKGYVYLIR